MKSKKEEQSRNSWIKEDNPLKVSNQQKDGYEDILHKRRKTGEFWWTLRTRDDVPQYKWNKPRTPTELKTYVMGSDRVKYAVEQVIKETGTPIAEVYAEAKDILEEMAHNLRMGAIRSLALVLPKVFKSIYRRFYVNTEGIQMLRSMIQEYPVLLMPSHRSYADFLLLSYVFFHYDLPLPVIAAAMDFMGMKFIGSLLRNSGAFYIRRSFGTDKLYWAVFTEYVQTQLNNGDHPVEFFVEGTRSRTSKSYPPRIGMLSASLEPYFKAHVPDIMVVPVSISYDRILEEQLYAYELLGIPKPKESTSGLMKARGILDEDFGNVHMNIGAPVSIRQYSLGRINRMNHSTVPRYIASLTDQEQRLIEELAYHMVIRQQQNMVISPWALCAAVLMQNREGIRFKQLVKEVDWLKRQAAVLGTYVDWPAKELPEAVVRWCISMHTNLVTLSPEGIVEIKVEKPTNRKMNPDDITIMAASHVALASYRNHLLHVFIRPGMIALAINASQEETMTLEDLYKKYEYLERMLRRDFIFQLGHTKQDFDQSLLNLTHSGNVSVTQDNKVLINKSTNKNTAFHSQMFEPFLLGYWVMCQFLLSMNGGDSNGKPLPKSPSVIVKETQSLAANLLQENIIKHYEVMSKDMLGNALQSFVEMGAVFKEKRNGDTYLSPSPIAVNKIAEEIGKYIEVPRLSIANFTLQSKAVLIGASKL
ncbi:unnamed protein product [Owenia fusiformis]|uniref:Uncharacterized protein n=1 Tax=Owenia fusiformis TaxID=6347 RepID=A0A8J1UM27_OWEFU|nr:unnamed protein product [Owenia fusiformis]